MLTNMTSPSVNKSVRRRTAYPETNHVPNLATQQQSMEHQQNLSVSPESGGGALNKILQKRTKRGQSGKSHDDTSIVPLWLVVVLCGLFLVIGYGQQQYATRRKNMRNPKIGVLFPGDGNGNSRKVSEVGSGIKGSKKRSAYVNSNKKSLLSPEEDIELEIDSTTGLRYHIVFSTDCSPYQHWQSYLVYYSAMKIKQPGHVTRIVSGCSEGDETDSMMEWFTNDVQFMSPKRFHIQLTPKFSTVKNDAGEIIGDYKFFNKPFGLQYWMEHSDILQYKGIGKVSNVNKSFPDSVAEDVVILIDPDMGLIRPIRADFSNPTETIVGDFRKQHYASMNVTATGKDNNDNNKMLVRPGHPFAQTYGFGTQWQRLDLVKVTGDPHTPAANVSHLDGRLFYPVGPPYLATVEDMYNIAVHWSKFVPGVYDQYPHLLAEMFAFCIAAAHLQLPHILIDSLMVSDVDVGASLEGWKFIDQLEPPGMVCDFAYDHPVHTDHPVPNVFHMCQRYMVGDDWFFSKRKMPPDVYDCSVPLFERPPSNLATILYKHPPGGGQTQLSQQMAQRHTFAICFLYGLINSAATFHKSNSCPKSSETNMKLVRNLARIARHKE